MALPEREFTKTSTLPIIHFPDGEKSQQKRDTIEVQSSSAAQLQQSIERLEHSPPCSSEPTKPNQPPAPNPVQEPASATPPSFTVAFARFEPMFHTVFFRKYHPDIRDDAKQVALLALYLKWCKDKAIFDQTAAFVVTAAVWGISNWRKKEMKRLPYENPLVVDEHGHVIGAPRGTQAGRWTDRIDFQIDLDRAIDAVLWEFNDHPHYKAIYGIVQDVVDDVPFKESWSKTTLPRGEFKKYQEAVKQKFAEQLREYSPSAELVQ